MKKHFAFLFATFIFCTATAQQTAKLFINANDPKTVISKHIYGQFSEQLGRCIYDGLCHPWQKN